MERKNSHNQTPQNTFKNVLTIGALAFALLGNPSDLIAQKQNTSKDLAKNITKPNEAAIKQYFVNTFAPAITSIDTISDMPFKVKYKNQALAQRHDFPDSIDVNPKLIKKGEPKSLVVVTLGDKKYNIVPYRGIKIRSMKLVPSKTLDEPKAILTLELIGFVPWNIEISSKEFAEYIYDLSRMPVGQKSSLWGIHVEVSNLKKPSPAYKAAATQMADGDSQKSDTNLAKVSLQ